MVDRGRKRVDEGGGCFLFFDNDDGGRCVVKDEGGAIRLQRENDFIMVVDRGKRGMMKEVGMVVDMAMVRDRE